MPFIPAIYKDTIYCYSFSKTLSLPGERIGFLAIHPELTDYARVRAAIYGAGRALGYINASTMFQLVAAECVGQTADISVYKQNRDLIHTALLDMGYTCVKPSGAFYLFLKTPEPDATLVSAGFSALISLLVCVFAQPLMRIFVQAGEVEVLAAGVRYLRIEGACYVGIGCLFLLYGFYRAVKRPGMSVVLTVISLGVRVALAYLLAGPVGEIGIWAAIPIGWALADVTGYGYYLLRRAKLLPEE